MNNGMTTKLAMLIFGLSGLMLVILAFVSTETAANQVSAIIVGGLGICFAVARGLTLYAGSRRRRDTRVVVRVPVNER